MKLKDIQWEDEPNVGLGWQWDRRPMRDLKGNEGHLTYMYENNNKSKVFIYGFGPAHSSSGEWVFKTADTLILACFVDGLTLVEQPNP